MALIRRNDESIHDRVDKAMKVVTTNTVFSFINDEENAECTFRSSLFAYDRAYVHSLARSHKLMSKSRGKGQNRQVTVYKRELSSIIKRDASFHLKMTSHQLIMMMMAHCPFTAKEKLDVTPHSERDRTSAPDTIQRELARCPIRLSAGVPLVPGGGRRSIESASAMSMPHRQQLPIFALRESIIANINDHPVIVICGETGSGKTTQVPQYIMESHQANGRPCHIICAQPRRIAAIAMAERVAAERNCKLGQEVGYHIGYQSVCNSRTVLTYTTYSIVVRTLMSGGDSALATTTHLILDELQLRDCAADLLLVWLRESLPKQRQLRLVLIAAGPEEPLAVSKYFANCPVLTVPSRLYEVKQYYLEDIIKRTGYMTNDMLEYKNNYQKRIEQDKIARDWMNEAKEIKSGQNQLSILNSEKTPSEEKTVDHHLEEATRLGSRQSLEKVLHLIKNDKISVDYQHPASRLTPLIVASIHGHVDVAEELLNLGASVQLSAAQRTAFDHAVHFQHQNIIDLLTTYQSSNFPANSIPMLGRENLSHEDDGILVEAYKQCFNEDHINADLILALIDEIQASNQKGAVLIFLPGYEDIMMLNEKLQTRAPKPGECKLVFTILHSKMDPDEQKKVLAPQPKNVRKVILTSSIGESCITIQDVVFVIDSGLVKEHCIVEGVSGACGCARVRTQRCSQACVRQRRARAGRSQPGVCYHLFSSRDYMAMATSRKPEILRTPLQNLCLQTKMLTQGNIADLLAKTMEPPSFAVVRACVQLLKTRDALDPCEEVTLLGQHLVDLPLPPHLGKALIYAVLLKCLDPVLTIVAMLCYEDPFLLPDSPSQRRELQMVRRRLAGGRGESDHCLLLQVYMHWLTARNKGPAQGRAFCQQHFLCEPRLELVHAQRIQLLQQLRSAGFVRAKDSSDLWDLNLNSERLSVVKAALTGGLYPNLVRVDRDLNVLKTHEHAKVVLDPWSVVRGSRLQRQVPASLASDWLVYEELTPTGKSSACVVRVCSLVTDLTVAIFAGSPRFPHDYLIDPEGGDCGSDSEEEETIGGCSATLKVDEWAAFRLEPYVAKSVITLRDKFHALLTKRLRTPSKPLTQQDDLVIQTLAEVLSIEENEAGLQQPTRIGTKPLSVLNGFPPPLTSHSLPHPNQNNEYSPQGRRYHNDLPKQMAALEVQGNRFLNQRRTYDMNEKPADAMGLVSTSNTSTSSMSSPTASASSSGASCQEQASGSPGAKKFFILKYGNARSFDIAVKTNIWFFQANTEIKVKSAFREGKTVILVMSLQGSSQFQGYAKLQSDICEWNEVQSPPPPLGVPLPIEWIKIGNIQVTSSRHVLHVNEYNKLQTCRDGQDIEFHVGEALCHMWDNIPPPNSAAFHLQGYHHQGSNPYGNHGRAIRAPPQMYYGGGPHPANNMRKNM